MPELSIQKGYGILTKRVGIDVDGILANFFPAYEKLWIEESGGINLFPANTLPPVWNWPEHYGYDPAILPRVWDRIKADPNFWSSLKPFKGVEDFLFDLSNMDHEVYFITDRPGVDSQLQTQIWLEAQGYMLPNVIISRRGKGIICEALCIEVYIDDKPENLEDVKEHEPADLYMLDYPYNQHCRAGKRISKLEDFLAVL